MALNDSASAKAEKAKLQAELAEINAELEEKQYQNSIETQKDTLNQSYENFEKEKNDEIEALEKSLEDQENIISQSFNAVKQNSDTIGQEIANIAKKHGVTVSNTLITSWKQGENAIANYGSTLSTQTSAFIGNVVAVENEVYALQEKADVTSTSIANIFSNKADDLVSELVTSYNSLENMTTMSNALQDSLVSTLERGYDVSGILTAIEKVTTAVNDLSTSIGGLGKNLGDLEVKYEADVVLKKVGGSIKEADPLGTTKATVNKHAVSHYASGTRSTKGRLIVTDEEGYELKLPKLSSGNYTIANEGSQILTKVQTDNLFDWAKINPDAMIPWNVMDSFKTMPSVPLATNRVVERPVNINNSVTFTGDINDTNHFTKQITGIIDKQFDKATKEFMDSYKY